MIIGKYFYVFFLMMGSVLFLGNSAFAQTNLILGKPAVANSWDTAGVGGGSRGMPASLANDGDPGTRWATNWNFDANRDSGWIYVDLGTAQTIASMVIKWETAGAIHYVIQVANFSDPLSQTLLRFWRPTRPGQRSQKSRTVSAMKTG